MNDITFSQNKEKLDISLIHYFLHNHSYWAQNRLIDTIKVSVENSLCVGVYVKNRQIGFARIVSDFATVYYLADVFVIPEYQGRGIGKKLMTYISEISQIKNLRGILTTQTAHSFYEEFGFSRNNPVVQERIMVKERT